MVTPSPSTSSNINGMETEKRFVGHKIRSTHTSRSSSMSVLVSVVGLGTGAYVCNRVRLSKKCQFFCFIILNTTTILILVAQELQCHISRVQFALLLLYNFPFVDTKDNEILQYETEQFSSIDTNDDGYADTEELTRHYNEGNLYYLKNSVLKELSNALF